MYRRVSKHCDVDLIGFMSSLTLYNVFTFSIFPSTSLFFLNGWHFFCTSTTHWVNNFEIVFHCWVHINNISWQQVNLLFIWLYSSLLPKRSAIARQHLELFRESERGEGITYSLIFLIDKPPRFILDFSLRRERRKQNIPESLKSKNRVQ